MDPVTFSVLARRMDTVARTMQHTLVRASRSGVIASGHDCSCCILSGRHELLSAAQTIPIHVFSGADLMAKTMMKFHTEPVRGDAFLHNSPYHGCTHAADLSVLVPVLDSNGMHRFTVLAKAHQADIGKSKPTTYMADARDLYEEGALICAATAGGASPRGDGWLTLGNACTAGMCTMDSVEIDEINYPLRVDERMLLPDSEGAGKHRGASCCRVVYQPIGGAMREDSVCRSSTTASPTPSLSSSGRSHSRFPSVSMPMAQSCATWTKPGWRKWRSGWSRKVSKR